MPKTNHRLNSAFLFLPKSRNFGIFLFLGMPNPNGGFYESKGKKMKILLKRHTTANEYKYSRGVKFPFFHWFLVLAISVCDWIIKTNDAMAATCTSAQAASCSAQCPSPLFGSCVASYNTFSCSCYISNEAYSGVCSEFSIHRNACLFAVNSAINCGNGRKIHCISYNLNSYNCTTTGVNSAQAVCGRVFPINLNATSTQCSCIYSTVANGACNCFSCKTYYYGVGCYNSCPSYYVSGYGTIYGTSGKWGGNIGSCTVSVPEGCDTTGCYNAHTCPYEN